MVKGRLFFLFFSVTDNQEPTRVSNETSTLENVKTDFVCFSFVTGLLVDVYILAIVYF